MSKYQLDITIYRTKLTVFLQKVYRLLRTMIRLLLILVISGILAGTALYFALIIVIFVIGLSV